MHLFPMTLYGLRKCLRQPTTFSIRHPISPYLEALVAGGLWSPGWATASLLRVGLPVRGHARGVHDDVLLFPLPFSFAPVPRRLPVGVGLVQIGSEKVQGYGQDDGRVLFRGDLAHSLEEPKLQGRGGSPA